MEKLKSRNNSIDIFRYVFAIMVVAIHTEPIFYMLDAVYFIGFEILAKLAVPFFFAVAGYFYIGKLIKGEPIFLNYIKKLIFVYSMWTVFYYLKDLLLCILKNEPLDEFFINCVSNYFIYGSYFNFGSFSH